MTRAFLVYKKQRRNCRNIHYSSQKNNNIFHIFDQIKFHRVTLLIGHCSGGSLDITRTVPLINGSSHNKKACMCKKRGGCFISGCICYTSCYLLFLLQLKYFVLKNIIYFIQIIFVNCSAV